MEWTKKHIITALIVVGVLICADIVIRIAIYVPSRATLSPTQIKTNPTTPQVQQILLCSGADHEVMGDVSVGGIFIRYDVLNDILNRRNINGEVLYKHFLAEHSLHKDMAQAIKQATNPSFFELKNTGKMCVKFKVMVDDTIRKVRVNTKDYIETLVYYLAVIHGRRVMFRVGQAPPTTTANRKKEGVFPSSLSFVDGEITVGTPYNFVPLFPGESNAAVH